MPPKRTSHASAQASTSSARSASASKARRRPNSAASSTRPASRSKMVKKEPVSADEQEEDDSDAQSDSEDVSSDEIAVAPSRSKAAPRAGPSSRKASAITTTAATASRKPSGKEPRKGASATTSSSKKAIVESSDENESTSEDEMVVSRLVKREPQEASISQSRSSANTSRQSRQESTRSSDSEDNEDEVPIKQAAPVRKQRAPPVKQEPQASESSEDDEEDTPVPATHPESAQTNLRGSRTAEDASTSSSRASTPAPGTPPLPPTGTPHVTTQEQTDDTPIEPDMQLAPPKADLALPIIEEGPKKRLVIHKIVLVDFKSYAGRQEIGPFHKSFSSIVGPNGSGKSNTIDALLFVFGFKATKMRQGKLAELIHNSEGKEDIPSCSVEVWFREIIDLPDDDAFEIVPDSTLIVTRTAYRNNSSKYTINGKTSTFTEVTTLLKDKGIDLDHKRFLILQGEVESIAQMKPKAPNEHEDGLLEYLEDIIGTSKYKEPIATCLEEVDRLNEERLEKTNRVKLVEREKASLEAAKKEADAYVKDQNQLTLRQSELYQVYQFRYQGNMAIAAEAVETASKQLQVERDSQAGMRHEVEELDNEYQTLARDHKELEKHTNEVSKELVAFEREDVQMQEKRKHLINKQKKLKKTIHDDTLARSEASTWQKSYGEDMEKLKAELVKHETSLAREEAELEKICDGLKDKTAGFSAQIDVKQAELQPWLDKLAEKQAAVDLATNQRDLLKEKAASIERGIEEAQSSLQEIQAGNAGKEEQLEASKAEYDEMKATLQGLKADLQKIQAHDQKLRNAASSARQKTEEAKASQAASRSKGDVLSSLTKLKEQGRLNGFHGRLGNLGRIDDKYDVAISTACPGLDNLVCDTVEAGQACLEHLRRNNLGRATILCLGSLAKRDLQPIDTPESVPRLFDLVTPKDAKLASAFYQVLQNTLVAKDLEQANRIAFGSKSGGKRWRVVTLDGKLIDVSGTMSGGGNRVARGAMSSKFTDDGEVTLEAVARLEKESSKAEEAVQTLSSEKQEKEQAIASLQRKLPEVEMQVSKTEMALRAGKKRIEEAQKRIRELQGENRPQTDDVKKIAILEKEIEKLSAEHTKLQTNVSKIQAEIKSLQEKILEVGGVKLRSQQVKVEGIKEMSDHANDQLTKAEVGKNKAEKDLIKLDKALKTNGLALEEVEEELTALEKSIREKTAGLESVRRNVEEAKAVLEEKSEELAELKALLDEKQADMNKFRAKETELEQEVEKAKRKLAENEKSLASVVSRLERLELQEIDEDDDDEEVENEEERQPKQVDELKTFTEEELEEFDAETLKGQIALLEERIQAAKPNLAVLKEYRRREKEFLERAQDLERITQARDAAKQSYDDMRKQRLDEFMAGFNVISMKLKEMYQMITLGGNAELELVDSLDPFSEGIIFSVMPPKKSWKNISNLSGGEKTLSSLALVFALHVFKPTPLYFMDEIDAALDFRNVSIVANYIKERTKNAQFIIISLRNNMFELASRLVGVYKVQNATRSVCIDNEDLSQYP